MPGLEYDTISSLIDHSVLRPEATHSDVVQGAETAMKYRVASLCIRPSDVELAGPIIRGSGVRLCTVIGFPHGADVPSVKMEAVNRAVGTGAEELDVVLNIGQLLSGNSAYVEAELRLLTENIHAQGCRIKVIFENCYLDESHIAAACSICNDIGADWVKTSTGFGTGGAVEKDVALMRQYTKADIGIKASGGIRTLDDLLKFHALGCSRIGTSATEAILEDLKNRIAG